jgi:hypothetical protein
MSDPREQAKQAHELAMQSIGFAAQILTPHADAIGALIDADQRMHSYLHITDPTLYRRAIHSKGLKHQVRLAKAALAFILEVQGVKRDLGHGGIGDE